VSATTTRLWRPLVVGVALGLALAGRAAADEVLLLNGDRLTGTIVSAAGGKLTIKTEAAGDVTVDLAKVKTFSTDEPVTFKIGDTVLRSRAAAGADGTVQILPIPGERAQVVALKDLTEINPPPVKWTGALSFNGYVTTGNSETTNIGASFNAIRRAEQDRITLAAAYNFGRQKDRDTGDESTTVDNMFGFAKYDYFLTKKFYLYGSVRAERDRIADLDLRFTPSAGVGYQWYETPTFNLWSEAGLAWVYEDFRHGGSDDHFAARFAYHVDWTPYKGVMLFHNLEWLPALDNPINDYNLNGDVGLRTTIFQGFFAEAKIELRYDSRPAPGAEKEDLRYILAVGWSF
jgi:putative salt-induced outer membrane protein YdiY